MARSGKAELILRVAIISIVALLFGKADGAVSHAAKGLRLSELSVVPQNVLRRAVSAKFYKSLLISPMEGWITVRGHLARDAAFSGGAVIRSDLNGAYDQLALKVARDVKISGYYGAERPNTPATVLVHFIVYKIADGMLLLSFAHLDESGGNQMQYFGCARLQVLKDGGKLEEIEGPDSGKGSLVRNGLRNRVKRMEWIR